MFKKVNLVSNLSVLTLALCVPGVGECGDAAPGERVKIEGSPYYIEEAAVKIKNDVATFRLYTSHAASDPGIDSSLNCATREFSARTGEQWSDPYRVLAGEPLYPVGKKLCDWDAKGFFKRFSF
jgi:hypothetical protein